MFFLRDLLEVLVDNSHSEEDTSSRSDGSHEVSEDAKSTNANSTEGGSGVNVSGQLLDHGLFSPAFNHELLLHELLHDIAGRLSTDIDPESGEESARAHHKDVVEQSVEGVCLNVREVARRADVVSQSTDGGSSAMDVILSPLSNEADEVVVGLSVLSVEDLREEIQVGDESSLEDDGDVGGIEQLDGVGHFVTTDLSVSEGEFDTESL